LWAGLAPAAEPTTTTPTGDIRSETPNQAYAYSAFGASPKTVGAQAYTLGVAALHQRGIVGGGLSVWGSPIDHLTLIGDAQRDFFGNFAPSLAVVGRLLGDRAEGFSLGALGKAKMEGFGSGTPVGAGTPPLHHEIEGEIEVGLLASYAHEGGLHADLNAITGMGTGDDGEVDSEGRLRVGYDVTRILRLGFDSQARFRLHGPRYLPNGKTWDFSVGPQAIVGLGRFYVATTAGPTTTGLLTDHVGWNAMISFGASTF
jgi:hypothetical protein